MNRYEMIDENRRRTFSAQSSELYDPQHGFGCFGERFLFSLSDSPIGDIMLPSTMKDIPIIKSLQNYKCIENTLINNGIITDFKAIDEAWEKLCVLRMKFDFEYFAFVCEVIRPKNMSDSSFIPFILNKGQRKVLEAFEVMRLNNQPIRAIILKARQWGCSTFVQLYMYWIQIIHMFNWNSVICAHKRDASLTIRAMYKLCADEMMPIGGIKYHMKAFEGAQNIRQVEERSCRITVGTAEEPDSVRAQDIKMAHFSEVAYFPNTSHKKASDLTASIISSVPLLPYTIVVYESTANGVGDFFYKEFLRAKQNHSPFKPIFVSWFELGDLYSEPINESWYAHNGVLVYGDLEHFIDSLNDYELNLFNNYSEVTFEHINWYRRMKSQIGDLMTQEYPSNANEAFRDTGSSVFRTDDVESLRKGCIDRPVQAVGTLCGLADPALLKTLLLNRRNVLRELSFVQDNDLLPIANSKSIDPDIQERKLNGKLVIWRFPDIETNALRRYIVCFDPQKGMTSAADWGSIVVIDRYWRMFGGKSEVVAEWRGHIDRDVSIWIAAQIATWYQNALLIVESNTFDSSYNKEDGTEFIFETISSCYFNLYSRIDASKVKDDIPIRYGFHMNKNTKPAIIAEYISTLRQKAYIERSERTLEQALTFERKDDGTYGAKDGCHDDDLVARMIALFIDYHEYSLPELIPEKKDTTQQRNSITESSFF